MNPQKEPYEPFVRFVREGNHGREEARMNRRGRLFLQAKALARAGVRARGRVAAASWCDPLTGRTKHQISTIPACPLERRDRELGQGVPKRRPHPSAVFGRQQSVVDSCATQLCDCGIKLVGVTINHQVRCQR